MPKRIKMEPSSTGSHRFMVLLRTKDMSPIDVPLGFACMADDSDHAEEQAQDDYPGACVLWIEQDATLNDAIRAWLKSDDDP